MIHYHGTPITPEVAAAEILRGRHAIVSFADHRQVVLVADVCHSYVFDNGAYSFWKIKKPVDWDGYYRFVDDWRTHPGFDWALIPDEIEGDEEANDRLIEAWPFSRFVGVPVWHLHESIDRLVTLALDWGRVALGSSGEFARVGTPEWWQRMSAAMAAICVDGSPVVKLHGLRMLDPRVFSKLPLSSADSTNIARNIGIDKNWAHGNYLPPTKAARGVIIATRVEHVQSAAVWQGESS